MFTRGRPSFDGDHLQTGCSWEEVIRLSAPVNGRAVGRQSWPTPVRRGMLRDDVEGLPRLLGLAPVQALRVLWIQGLTGRVSGHGHQVVNQLPGWGLASPRGGDTPAPFNGTAVLTAGNRIEIPVTPVFKSRAATGRLVVTLPNGSGSHPEPVVLYGAQGRLLARLQVRADRGLGLRLPPGRYLLVFDGGTAVDCGPARVQVKARQLAHAAVRFGCSAA